MYIFVLPPHPIVFYFPSTRARTHGPDWVLTQCFFFPCICIFIWSVWDLERQRGGSEDKKHTRENKNKSRRSRNGIKLCETGIGKDTCHFVVLANNDKHERHKNGDAKSTISGAHHHYHHPPSPTGHVIYIRGWRVYDNQVSSLCSVFASPLFFVHF